MNSVFQIHQSLKKKRQYEQYNNIQRQEQRKLSKQKIFTHTLLKEIISCKYILINNYDAV